MKKSHPRKKVVKVSSRKTSRKTIKKTSKRNRIKSTLFFNQEIHTGPPPFPQYPSHAYAAQLPPGPPPRPRFPPHGYAPQLPQRPRFPLHGYAPPLPPRPQKVPQMVPQIAPQMVPRIAPPRSRGFFSNLYNKYSKKGRIQDTACQVLTSTDQNEFSEKCNNLFQVGASKEVYNQYQMMKAKRPQAEVNNLCGNFAKTLL